MKHLINFFCTFNNAIKTKKNRIDVPNHYQINQLVSILYQERRIRGYQINNDILSLWLKYHNDHCVIRYIQAASSPSTRICSTSQKLPIKGRGLTLTLISTNIGILTHGYAIRQNIGGQVICWVF